MKLELKHIVGYLPYGLKVQYSGIINVDEFRDYNKRYKEASKGDMFFEFSEQRPEEVIGLKIGKIRILEICEKFNKYRIGGKGMQTHYGTKKFKPILRPLSDLTKEIEVNGEKFVPSIEYNHLRFEEISTIKAGDRAMGFIQVREQEILYQLHFDIHGLIPNNLAIDMNTLNESK